MIETRMARRMAARAVVVAPFVVAALWFWGGSEYAVSAGVGMAMAVGNLLLAARIIGGVAENRPQLLLAAAMGAFAFGLAVLTAIAFLLEAKALVDFRITGLTLVGAHLGLVLWEASGAYERAEVNEHVPARGGR